MLTRPALNPGFRAEVVEPDSVVLLSDAERIVLTGPLYRLVAPLLDGRRTADAIVECLVGDASAAEVYYALTLLEHRGLATEAVESCPPPQAAFWQALGLSPTETAGRLEAAAVTVISYGAVPLE